MKKISVFFQIPLGIESRSKRQLELIPANEHGAAAQTPQMLEDLQVVVSFNGVSDDGWKALKGFGVGLEVAGDLGLAVEVKGPSFDRRRIQEVLDLDALAAEKPIFGFAETVLEQLLMWRWRRGLFGYYSSQLEGF